MCQSCDAPRTHVAQRVMCSLAVCVVLVVCQAIPSMAANDETDSPITLTQRITSKGDAELICTVRDLGKRRIIWRRMSDSLPISVGTTRFYPDSRFRVTSQGDDSVKLTISDVEPKYSGEYQCRASGQEEVAKLLLLSLPKGPDDTHLLLDHPTRLKAEVGGEVLLPCHVENINSRLVMWKDSQNEVISLRRKIYNGDRRFTVVHDTRTEWSLRLRNIRQEDFGHYTCVVNSRPVLTRTITLVNSVPAKMAPVLKRDTNYRLKVEADHGDKVTLSCHFLANPPAKVYWYTVKKVNGKNSYTEIGRGNRFTLESVSSAKNGRYVCMGKNGMKPNGRGRTDLTVKDPPTTIPPTTVLTYIEPNGRPTAPHVYPHVKRSGQRRGANHELKCTVIGHPRPIVYWRRHDHNLVKSHKYDLKERNSGRHTKTSTLTIRSLSSRDYGEYDCVGRNSLGIVEEKVEIYETRPTG